MTYGGLPSGGNFRPTSEYVVGMSKIAEACHCILGSLQRSQERIDKGSEPRSAMESEFVHIDEEIGIIEKVINTYSNDRYIDLLNKGTDGDVQEFVDTARDLKSKAEDQREKLFRETYQDGTPKPMVEMAEEAYGFLIGFCDKIIRIHENGNIPFSYDENVYGNFMVELGVEYLRKQFLAYQKFETLNEIFYTPNVLSEGLMRELHNLKESELTRQELVHLRGAVAYNEHVSENARIGFEFNGVFVTNPFKDETGRFEVDPAHYYGMELINDFLQQYDKVVRVA